MRYYGTTKSEGGQLEGGAANCLCDEITQLVYNSQTEEREKFKRGVRETVGTSHYDLILLT